MSTDNKDETTSEANAETGENAVEVVSEPEVIEPWSRFDDWFENWSPPMFGRRWPELFNRVSNAEMIRVEQSTEDDEIVIRAELPGIDPDEDIDVSVAGGKVTISAKREQREETKTDSSYRSEFHYGSFRRTLPVPPGTAAEDVQAAYENGILEVHVPIDQAKEAATRVPVTRKG